MSDVTPTSDFADAEPTFEVALRVECRGTAEGDLTAVISQFSDGLRAALMVEVGGTAFRLHGPKALAFLTLIARDAVGFLEPAPTKRSASRRSAGF